MIKVYGIKSCDSVKKAVKFLQTRNLQYRFYDFKTDPVDCDKIKQWLNNIEIKTLFNTRSTTYRTLNLKELNLDNEEKLKWLCKDNILIKRPVIEYGEDKTLVGFNEKAYAKELL